MAKVKIVFTQSSSPSHVVFNAQIHSILLTYAGITYSALQILNLSQTSFNATKSLIYLFITCCAQDQVTTHTLITNSSWILTVPY